MKAGKGDPKLNFPSSQFLDLLAGVPNTFAYKLCGELVKADSDVVFSLGGKDAETVLEVLLKRKRLRLGESLAGAYSVAHPGQDECPHLAAVDVAGEAVPLVLNAGEVVGLDGTLFKGGRI